MERSYKPTGFEEWSVSTDIIILVMYEPFTFTACGVKPVKLARPDDKIREYYSIVKDSTLKYLINEYTRLTI